LADFVLTEAGTVSSWSLPMISSGGLSSFGGHERLSRYSPRR
jgi:hypothetical protein